LYDLPAEAGDKSGPQERPEISLMGGLRFVNRGAFALQLARRPRGSTPRSFAALRMIIGGCTQPFEARSKQAVCPRTAAVRGEGEVAPKLAPDI